LFEKKIQKPWIKCTFEENQSMTKLHVCDNGGGIEARSLEQIFLPYFSTKEQDKGRGIGLYLSKLIMEEHFSGSIAVHNEKEGACFTLTFPKK
jgi:signal transduction histidine kinase